MKTATKTPLRKGIQAFVIGFLVIPGSVVLAMLVAALFATPEILITVPFEEVALGFQSAMRTTVLRAWPVMFAFGVAVGLATYYGERFYLKCSSQQA